jgi:hypothetical protein
MKRILALACLIGFSSMLNAQATDTTVCDVLKNPAAFNNKIVQIKGTVAAGFDSFILQGPDCGKSVDAIWLQYPDGTKAKSGPAAMVVLQPAQNFAGKVAPAPARTPVTLDASKDFKHFDSALASQMKGDDMCLGCSKNMVEATLTGRIDAVEPIQQRDASGKITALAGFGNLNLYPVRLVIQSVSNVVEHPIDFKKDAAIAGTASEAEAAPRVSQSFASSISFQEHPKRAAEAFGKQGDNNGVVVIMTNPGTLSDKLDSQSPTQSPDGVLYNCLMNSDRLKGDAMARAIAHIGEHIADIRQPEPTISSTNLYQLEYRAWMTTMLSAMITGQKVLEIPGGYTLYSSARPQTNLNSNTDAAMTAFFSTEAMLSR